MAKQPRDYQEHAHTATWNYIHNPANYTGGVATKGKGPKYPLVVEATGLGKSMNIAMLMWSLITTYPGVRVLQMCHVKELVESNYHELLGMWPHAPAGIYAAGLGERDTSSQAIFAMINSVSKRAASFGKVDFVLIDEAHRLSDSDNAMYSKFLNELRKRNPNLIVIGYTATDYRMKGGKLTDMGLFDEVVYDIGSGESFLWAVEQGYLIMPVPTDTGIKLDDSGIGLSAGDFKNSEASDALRDQGIIEKAVDYSIAIAKEEGRQRSITFAQSIEDAELIADMFTYKGFETHAVHSKLKGDRDDILKAHGEGAFWGITNKDILTTGYNDPFLDMLIGLRLTRSPGLWVQMVGRMTRPIWMNHIGHNGGPPLNDISTFAGRWASIRQSGKINARVLDFCGNTERLGPINYPTMPAKRGKGGGEPPVRTCDGVSEGGKSIGMRCSPATIHHTSVKVCPHCGYEWPKVENISDTASAAELVIASMPAPPPPKMTIETVHEMTCEFNEGKKDRAGNKVKRDTLRVRYRCGYTTHSTWICFEHDEKSFARRHAVNWWRQHGGQGEAPTTIQEALDKSNELKKPIFIMTKEDGQYTTVDAYDFTGNAFQLPEELGGPPKREPDVDPIKKLSSSFKATTPSSDGMYFDEDIPF